MNSFDIFSRDTEKVSDQISLLSMAVLVSQKLISSREGSKCSIVVIRLLSKLVISIQFIEKITFFYFQIDISNSIICYYLIIYLVYTEMGNDQSYEYQPKLPIISKIIESLNLKINQQGTTQSMMHESYANSLGMIQNGFIGRQNSPFPLCKVAGICFTACLISPIMLITCSDVVYNRNNERNQIDILIEDSGKIVQLQPMHFIRIKAGEIVIIILQKPYWKVGWAGLTHIDRLKQFGHNHKVIYNSTIRMKQQSIPKQNITKLKLPLIQTCASPLRISSNLNIGSFLCKILNKKPYIIGIQTNGKQIRFLSKEDLNQIRGIAEKFLKTGNTEKEILKQINIPEFQIETLW